jgi:hypothetical protein
MLFASVGSAPAQASEQTAWIPLFCGLAGSIPVHVGASLTATVPDEVHPGDTFSITGTTTQTVFPPAAQQAGAVFNADGIQGIISIFETNLQNATVAFANTAGGQTTQSSPTQFNAVAAVQPPNQPASNVRINGGDTTRGGFQPSTPPETFSFGDAPADTTGASGNSFAPTPGVGGGFTSGAGTPDVIPDLGPITVTGAVGDNVVIQNKNPGGPDVAGIPAGNPRVVQDKVSFHTKSNTYTGQFPADCAFDTSADAIPSPNPDFVSQFTIPITSVGPPPDGVGTASARGTDPDASATVPGLGTFPVAAQYSAITNCDETMNNRPFIVRASLGGQSIQFTRTGTDTSTCTSSGSTNTNEGTGTGTVSGALSGPADVSWSFSDSPDDVSIDIVGDTGAELHISGAPQALSGSPGGVWVFGTLPWPAAT